jgi:hypothetical protein
MSIPATAIFTASLLFSATLCLVYSIISFQSVTTTPRKPSSFSGYLLLSACWHEWVFRLFHQN